MTYIAHIRQSDRATQGVSEHLSGVSKASGQAGAKIGVEHMAALAGLLHDMGKYTDEFYTYIEQAVANPDKPPRKGSVDHSTAGGKWLHSRYHTPQARQAAKLTAEWLANCIISHHQGLRDYIPPEGESPYLKRVLYPDLPGYEQAKQQFFLDFAEEEIDRLFNCAVTEFKSYFQKAKQHTLPPIAASLMVKYIFSCLIDADRSNTREFEEQEQPREVPDYRPFFQKSYDKLIQHLDLLNASADPDNPIPALRRAMSEQCEAFAFRGSGIYTLSIPTGGGKTLASMRYALRHALQWNKQRIIYVVPYTTIIEQNAAQIRAIFDDDDMILEHHSNVVDNADDERQDGNEGERYDTRRKKLKLARDNWDRPVIFTTMVQFLNTFFAKGTRNVRRLHQLSNAVIIFDEAQSVPVNCISLFNEALNFLHVLANSTLLLCTATQPALDQVKNKLRLTTQGEMVEQLDEVSQAFKRVELIDMTDQAPAGWKADELSLLIEDQMKEVNSTLVILNTKTAVRKLFRQLQSSAWVQEQGVRLVHLSTNMCAAHRKEVLSGDNGVIKALRSEKERVICISTQLIEAGVDISFECVIRSLAGLDSIAQAAGRCNRNREAPMRKVYIIRSADEVLTHLPEIRLGSETTDWLLYQFRKNPDAYGGELLSVKAMTCYFKRYFQELGDKLLYPISELEQNLFDLLNYNQFNVGAYNRSQSDSQLVNRSAIATAERYFEAISTKAKAVLVPYNEEGRRIIAELNGELGTGQLGELLRAAQQYTVNLYEHELKVLDKNDEFIQLLNGQALALRDTAYSDEFGVQLEGNGEWESLIS
ncbi:CRISPR-associated helicase Cas3' [Paenibacillus tengchongensis]|uniref:CRISPR-associated helicase Cas3' n=1 Tax=Paenibacillus tengchongensis TaxID=2608684 RepID=UPI00124D7EEC|nr:CRISPR-associated helicase Cas3' [Paenibacillus tengchongensis]